MWRVYIDNDSFPELRGVPPSLPRTRTWWRAIIRAVRRGDLVWFALVQLGIVAGFVGLATGLAAVGGSGLRWLQLGLVAAGLLFAGYLQVSWGGDMMRRHLRGVSDVARYACPKCGHSLFGHRGTGATVRCPECFTEIDAALFEPPFDIPRRFRVFPPWRR